MSDGYACLNAHAYVDNGLSAVDRANFEAAMLRDDKLRARVEAWQAQNEAIRLAFGLSAKSRIAPSLARPSNENNAGPKAVGIRISPALQISAQLPAPLSARGWGSTWLVAMAACSTFVLAIFGFCGGPPDPREQLMQHAAAALRAIGPYANLQLDFTSDDPRAVSAWLAPRFGRLAPDRLIPPGWSLAGVRVVPGLASVSALVMYEDAKGERAALLVEPMDAPPDQRPIGEKEADQTLVAGVERGFGYAAVGPERSGVGALVAATRSQ